MVYAVGIHIYERKNEMTNKKLYYKNEAGEKVEYKLSEVSLKQRASLVVEYADMVVSDEAGYAYLLKDLLFKYCLLSYYTDIQLFDEENKFSIDSIEKFMNENIRMMEMIIGYIGEDTMSELKVACEEAIEYRKSHNPELEKGLVELVGLVNELLESMVTAAKSVGNYKEIDMAAVNKLINIIPVMQGMGSKEVAKTILKAKETA